MESRNLRLVRSIYEGRWNVGDFSSTDWADGEVEFIIVDGPSPGRWTGIQGLTDGWRDFLSAWEHWHYDVDEYHELDQDRVLVLVEFRGRGKLSGLQVDEVHAKGAHLAELRAGKVVRAVFYFDRDRALADLGLDPELDTRHT